MNVEILVRFGLRANGKRDWFEMISDRCMEMVQVWLDDQNDN